MSSAVIIITLLGIALLACMALVAFLLWKIKRYAKMLIDTDAGMKILLARDDAGETVKRLEALLENAPDVLSLDDEARYSRAIEEGIANLLQYQVGKGGSGHDNGSDGF